MIIPQPKDLPPRAQSASRELTNSFQDMTNRTQQYSSDVTVRFKQSNTQLQWLSEQVKQLQVYVNALPGDTRVYNSVVTNIGPSTSWATFVTLPITLPAGYTRVDVFALGAARIVDTTSPFITGGQSRFLVNGSARTAINQRYPWNSSPPENIANSSVAVSNSGNITLEFQLIEDQIANPAGYSYAQICAFAVFY